MALCMTSALTKLFTVHISASHPIITSNHFKHISPTNFPSFQLSLFTSMLPVSFSWGHDHELRDTSFSLQHMDTWHFLSLPPRSICLWYTFFSPHRQQEGGLKKRRDWEIIISHPGQWCEVKHVAHTSTPLGRCLCIDTGAGALGRLF